MLILLRLCSHCIVFLQVSGINDKPRWPLDDGMNPEANSSDSESKDDHNSSRGSSAVSQRTQGNLATTAPSVVPTPEQKPSGETNR